MRQKKAIKRRSNYHEIGGGKDVVRRGGGLDKGGTARRVEVRAGVEIMKSWRKRKVRLDE